MHDLWIRRAGKEVIPALKVAVVAPDKSFTEKDNQLPFKLIHKVKVQSRFSINGFHPSFNVSKTLP